MLRLIGSAFPKCGDIPPSPAPLDSAVLTPACTHLLGSFISRRLLLRFSLALLSVMLGTHRLPARRTGYRSGVM